MSDYPSFPKIPRFNRTIYITEKIDGTNALIEIERVPFGAAADTRPGIYPVMDDSELDDAGMPVWEFRLRAGSRNRWLSIGADNHGFAAWVRDNKTELVKLGPGRHYGEWYGKGIQRGYGLNEKRFALFNTARWFDERPECCDVVPLLAVVTGDELTAWVEMSLAVLQDNGSAMVPGFMRPEGIILFHSAAGQFFKILLEGDDIPKGLAA